MKMINKNLIRWAFSLLLLAFVAGNLGRSLQVADSAQFSLTMTMVSILLSLSAIVFFYKAVPASRWSLVALAVAVIAGAAGFMLALYGWNMHVANAVLVAVDILIFVLSLNMIIFYHDFSARLRYLLAFAVIVIAGIAGYMLALYPD
jgi:hypothetical protein